MNVQLRRTAVVALAMIIAIMVNITLIMAFQSDRLRQDSRNARQFNRQYERDRGAILAGDVQVAYSVKNEDGKTYDRRYREGEVFSPVTGYFGAFSKTGLEQGMNAVLDGTDSTVSVRGLVDWITGKLPKGGDVHTTIVPRAQRVAYRQLKASTSLQAAAVAVNAETGAIEAMASYPSYDPATVSVRDASAASGALKKLEGAAGDPLLNKATRELYPPGSSFKIVTAAAALAHGIAEDGTVPAGASYRLPGTTTSISNSHDSGPCSEARTTLINAFAQSCNTTFAEIGAEEVGNAGMREQSESFGYGTRFEYAPGLNAVASDFPDTDAAQTALASYGQGANVATVLQMALVAAAVENDGVLMRPHLVEKITVRNATIDTTDPVVFGRAVTAGRAAELRQMMEAVVSEGTATNLQGDGVAGKTGTADVDGAAYNDRWFVGYTVSGPHAIAVMTQGAGYGGSVAGPIMAAIAAALT
ncbi:cell elongation-specific peptidoglycan D,D-transpeptidase [Actinocorallia herbida]|uniref:Cell elongation-specific peptidoglycan D,D-transpeptidase n=1 Tax=Actinocorallia herbida TaxID=58109 RepID=A0A3N1CPX3_9ACTN|nr:penicillin-binding transpeptidase domain-containing protein [Actinocorallia herbida]ROO83376.1 cell elongation-specific peptidoglycan D,D-transpeptidase [Actinocorallia herbida]